MDIRTYLNQIRHLDLLIDSKLEQVSQLRNRMIYVSPTFGERVQGSHDPDKFTNGVAKIIELEKVINEDIDKLVDMKVKAREIIETLNTVIEKAILYKHYFEGKSFEDIAVEVNYSLRWVYKIHGDAIDKLSVQFNSL